MDASFLSCHHFWIIKITNWLMRDPFCGVQGVLDVMSTDPCLQTNMVQERHK